MRDHWNQATATLDIPTASPYAVSYFSLVKHWELFREIQACRVADNVLTVGTFEPSGNIPKAGIPVDGFAGWSARFGTLDRVEVAAGIVSSAKLEDKNAPKPPVKKIKLWNPGRPIVLESDDYVPPAPQMGNGVLKLEVRLQVEYDKEGKPAEQPTRPLERTFLAVESPAVRLPPGTLVRVSGWVKIPDEIRLTADGVLFYDDIGGEPLGVRLVGTRGRWKQFHLYRRVPESGQMTLTVALTGIGVAYFDDLRIEPLLPAGQASPLSGPARVAAPLTTTWNTSRLCRLRPRAAPCNPSSHRPRPPGTPRHLRPRPHPCNRRAAFGRGKWKAFPG